MREDFPQEPSRLQIQAVGMPKTNQKTHLAKLRSQWPSLCFHHQDHTSPTGVQWNLINDNLSLSMEYRDGRVPVTAEKVRMLMISLGLKFGGQ